MTNLLGRCLRTCVAAGLSLGVSFAAHASYSNLFVFGDSLTDTGNVYLASAGNVPLSPPYYDGRFSNGPLWIETVASGLGLPAGAKPSLLGGNNFAWAGAFSDSLGLAAQNTGLAAQVFGQWKLSYGGIADPNALYVIGIGGNDLRYIAPDNTYSPQPYSNPQTLLANFTNALDYLIAAGARNFLVADVPNLGLVPEALRDGHSAESTQLAAEYNALLADALNARRQNSALSIFEISFFDMLSDVIADTYAGGTVYGFANPVVPCIMGTVSCDTSVFFDDLHPTARIHQLVGEAALAMFIPEPEVLPLVAIALLLAIGFGRRRPRSMPLPA